MKEKSKCCKCEVIVKGGAADFGNYDNRGQTFHFVCQKCNKPCDIIEIKRSGLKE